MMRPSNFGLWFLGREKALPKNADRPKYGGFLVRVDSHESRDHRNPLLKGPKYIRKKQE
jgi:hypothetical protein